MFIDFFDIETVRDAKIEEELYWDSKSFDDPENCPEAAFDTDDIAGELLDVAAWDYCEKNGICFFVDEE